MSSSRNDLHLHEQVLLLALRDRKGTLEFLHHRTARGLCRRGILRQTESSVLVVFKRRAYPTLDPGPERSLVARLREAIGGDGQVAPELGVVLAVAHATGMLGIHFDRKLLSRRKDRLKEMVAGKHLSPTRHQTLAAIQGTHAAHAAVVTAVAAETAFETAASAAAASS